MRRLLVAILLGACDGPPLPRCPPGAALTTDAEGQIVCHAAPIPPALPRCAAPQHLLTSDGRSLGCIATAEEDEATRQVVASLSAGLADVRSRLDRIAAPRSTALFIGPTPDRQTARLDRFVCANSFVCAAESCAAAFGAGAHLCTLYDLYTSVAVGSLRSGDQLPPSWVYFPSSSVPIAGAVTPELGLADTCGSYTATMNTLRWSGMTVEWTSRPTGTKGLAVHGGADVGCSYKSLPVACCL